MSVQATTWVWEQRRWTGNVLLVALAIADAANREGNGSCQSAGTIGAMIGAHRATVFRAIKRLEADGALVREGVHPKYGTVIWSMPLGLGDTPSEGSQSATGEGVANCDGGRTSATDPVAPVRHNPISTPVPSVVDTTSEGARVERATGVSSVPPPEPDVHPSRSIPANWQPRGIWARYLMRKYPGIDVRESARRFTLHHVGRQDTSRSWEAALEVWVSHDHERWMEQQGTDDLGVPKGQRGRKITAAQPGDPDYVSPEELDEAARRV